MDSSQIAKNLLHKHSTRNLNHGLLRMDLTHPVVVGRMPVCSNFPWVIFS